MASVKSAFSTTIHQQTLLRPRQKILVAVSGGLDSLVLTKLLRDYQRSAGQELVLAAAHVSLPEIPLPTRQRTILTENLEKWQIPLAILQGKQKSKTDFNCYRCAQERRKQLCIYSDQNDFDAIALGHNRDDYLETGLLNLIHHGHLESLAYRETMFQGQITIIRPLLSIAKKQLRQYARQVGIHVPKTNCPYGDQSHRTQVRHLIRDIARLNKAFRKNLGRTIDRWNIHLPN